jgi:hypothetical protein
MELLAKASITKYLVSRHPPASKNEAASTSIILLRMRNNDIIA